MRKIRPAGDHAILVDLGDVPASELHRAATAIRNHLAPPACVPGHSSLLLVYEEPMDCAEAGDGIAAALESSVEMTSVSNRRIEIAVSFAEHDAPDLPELLETNAISRDEFLHAIGSVALRARFLGFRPGFAYLDGVPEPLRMPRRATSRARVPAGSFAIAGAMAGFYPAEGPGGWNILGRTTEKLWDPSRERPNRIAAGDIIRIVPVERSDERSVKPPTDDEVASDKSSSQPRPDAPIAEILRSGQHTVIVGSRELSRYERGLAPGGPFDAAAAAAANLAVGNDARVPLLECAYVGPKLKLLRDTIVAVCGADAEVRVGGLRVEHTRQFAVKSGEILDIGALKNGARCYVAIRGGVEAKADRSGLEPAALLEHRVLHGGANDSQKPRIRPLARDDRFSLAVRKGPHDDAAVDLLLAREWEVSSMADRTGVRLHSRGSPVNAEASMPSCGILFGSVQHHPNGELVIMGPDHPITGGYPQPFTIVSSDLWKVAQLRPRDIIRFHDGPLWDARRGA
jgi:KipI family sensor histidine kinase inhibitor